MSKIDGEVLLGFGDFFEPGRTIGAAAPAKPAAKTPPKALKRTVTKGPTGKAALKAAVSKYPSKIPAKGQSAIEKHGKVLKAAHNTATKAVNAVMKSVKVLGNAKTAAVAAKPVTAHIGAAVVAAASQGKLTPKAQAAVAKHNAAVQKANQANKVLAQHALKTKQAVQKLAKAMTAQKKVAVALRTPGPKKTSVGHLLSDPMVGCETAHIIGDYNEAIGQLVQGTIPPDPANPGYLMDGSPDPAYGATTTDPSLDPSLGMPSLGDPSLDPLGIDSGAQLPPVPDVSYQEPDAHAVGGIIYTGQKGYPDGFVGSLGLMTRTTDDDSGVPQTAGIDPVDHFGYVWGKYWDRDNSQHGIPFGNNLQSGTWNHVRGREALLGDNWWNTVAPPEAYASNAKNSPQGRPYGPLVGNPAMPDFAQMRVDYGGNMFWYPQAAPDWITFPLKQAAALTAQAAQQAQAAADAANAAAMQAMQQQAALAQAQQDAANALAESQAQSAANQAQYQAQGDQAQVETQAQQALVAQQAQQLAEQQQAAPLLAQQAQMNLQQQQQALAVQQQMIDYAAQHPDEAYGPVDDGSGGGDDGSGDDGSGAGDDGGGYDDDPGVAMSDDDILSQAASVGAAVDAHPLPFPGQGANDGEVAGTTGDFDDGLGIPGGELMGDFDGEGFIDG